MAVLSSEIDGLIQKMGDLMHWAWRGVKSSETRSLSEVVQVANVEPLTIVSKDCLNLSYTSDILQSLLTMFSAYYLQAVTIMGSVDSVKVIRVLDKLNPDRKFNDLFIIAESSQEYVYKLPESFKYRLPTTTNSVAFESERSRVKIAMEVGVNKILDKTNVYDEYDYDEVKNPATNETVHGKDTILQLVQASNLAVGKVLSVKMSFEEGHQIEIPVTVRLATTVMPTESLVHLLTSKTDDVTFTERWHAWRSGRIRFIQDLVLCQDLIDEHRKALIKDKEGVYTEILNRVKRGKGFGFLANNPSLATASNLFVITEEDAKEIEKKISGKISNSKSRERLFKSTYAMIIAVVDRDWERVSFYIRGIDAGVNVSIKDLKPSSKDKGPDILDILKSLQAGQAPSF